MHACKPCAMCILLVNCCNNDLPCTILAAYTNPLLPRPCLTMPAWRQASAQSRMPPTTRLHSSPEHPAHHALSTYQRGMCPPHGPQSEQSVPRSHSTSTTGPPAAAKRPSSHTPSLACAQTQWAWGTSVQGHTGRRWASQARRNPTTASEQS